MIDINAYSFFDDKQGNNAYQVDNSSGWFVFGCHFIPRLVEKLDHQENWWPGR